MERFSDRIGVTSRPVLELHEVPHPLLVSLWNAIQPLLFQDRQAKYAWRRNLENLYDFLHWRTTTLSYNTHQEILLLESYLFNDGLDWYEALNFVDFVAHSMWDGRAFEVLSKQLNSIFEREGSPYRYVGGALTPIADPAELAELSNVQAQGDRFSGAREHILTALQFLGLRPEPDYRNAIKEAISAVESTLKVLTTATHLDLSGALKEFVKTHPIHGALMKGLDTLYGYTSNEHGLRHSLLEADAKVGFAEAKFMIVACAAFMNYLILRSGEP